MNYDEFFSAVRTHRVELSFDNPGIGQANRLSNEALFHLPLIAMTLLVLAKDKRKPKVDEIGQFVGQCFERTLAGFRGSSQHLGWSANLRMRTVRALTFLELAKLVSIEKHHKKLTITDIGKSVIERAITADNDLSLTLKVIAREYRNIAAERQLSMGLE